MLLKRVLKYMKSIFYRPKYYHEEYGWYNIVNVKFRNDYLKAEALIVNDDGIWYKVPYIWLMDSSLNENGYPAKIDGKWIFKR